MNCLSQLRNCEWQRNGPSRGTLGPSQSGTLCRGLPGTILMLGLRSAAAINICVSVACFEMASGLFA